MAELDRKPLVDEEIGAVHSVKVKVGSGGVAAVPDTSQQCAAPDHLAFVDLQTGLLQVGVVAELAVGVADGDGVAEQAPHIAAHHGLVGDGAGGHVRHIETEEGDFAACRGVDRLIPAEMVGKRAAVALMCAAFRAQLDEVESEGLAVDLGLVQVAPVAGLNGPPCAGEGKVEVGLLLVIGDWRLAVRLQTLSVFAGRACARLPGDRCDLHVREAIISMEEKLEAAHGEAGVCGNGQVGLAGAVADDAGGPALLEEQLMAAKALEDEALQLGIAVVSGDAKVESDLLDRSYVGKRQPVVEARKNSLRARLQRESGRQGRSSFIVAALPGGMAVPVPVTRVPCPLHSNRNETANRRLVPGAAPVRGAA